MKEGQFSNYSHQDIDNAENQYFENIKHDKDLVWERIEVRLKKRKIIPLWFYYAAASILIMLSMGTIFKYKLDDKNQEIAALKNPLYTHMSINQATKIEKYIEWKTDTIKIINQKIVSIPVQTTDTLFVHDTITCFLVKNDTIYINKLEKKTEKNLLVQENISDNQIVEQNSITKKKKRNKRFVFQFGKSQTESLNIEPQSLISLKTK